MTIGEDRVRIRFNPSSVSEVDKIKQSTAMMIDYCDTLKHSGEQARCASLAQTAYEEAEMWAVKAATWGK